MVRLHGVVDQVGPLHVARRVEAFDAAEFLGAANALFSQMGAVLLGVDHAVGVVFSGFAGLFRFALVNLVFAEDGELSGEPIGLA